jgi:hypothetical protein
MDIQELLDRDSDYQLILDEFSKMGYKIISWANTENTSGPDLHVQKENLVLRVEVKKARTRPGRNSSDTPIVEEARKNDDLIAIVFPSKYVLIETMKNHLKCSSEYGTRSFYGIF